MTVRISAMAEDKTRTAPDNVRWTSVRWTTLGGAARTLGRLTADPKHRNRVLQAGLGSARTTFRAFGKVSHILWLEITGLFFLLFALIGSVEFVRKARAHDLRQMAAAAGIALLFGYFGVSSFWQARKRAGNR